MAIIKCNNGHYYDNTKFSQCPHCGVLPIMEQEQREAAKPKRFSFFGKQGSPQAVQNSQVQTYGDSDHTVAMIPETNVYGDSDRTIALQGAGGMYDDDRTIALTPTQGGMSRRDDDDDRTIAIPTPPRGVSRHDDDDDRTIAIPTPPRASRRDDDDDRTIAIPTPPRGAFKQDDDDDHTIAIPTPPKAAVPEPPVRKEDSQISSQTVPAGRVNTVRGEERLAETQPRDYVVGWLVCVDGPEKGRDYRLYRGLNRLGGSSAMDILVESDPQLRTSVAVVVYDDKSNSFLAAPQAGGRALLKGKELQTAEKLVSGDILEAGESKFQFIPFCCEGRTWESHE